MAGVARSLLRSSVALPTALMSASATPTRPTPRPELPVRLQARLIAGLRTACSVSAQVLRRLDRDDETPEDPAIRAYA